MDITSQISCFSKYLSSLTKEDMVKSPKNEMTSTEENIIQSIFRLEKKEKIPVFFLYSDSGNM